MSAARKSKATRNLTGLPERSGTSRVATAWSSTGERICSPSLSLTLSCLCVQSLGLIDDRGHVAPLLCSALRIVSSCPSPLSPPSPAQFLSSTVSLLPCLLLVRRVLRMRWRWCIALGAAAAAVAVVIRLSLSVRCAANEPRTSLSPVVAVLVRRRRRS